ncbi:right-handed parallel beta-helix repeat-containing protein [Dyadobacter bucti]|uniref:right-handed parallel beta-helix repeat-containing protein n=1 Tax=Dyadobacter bucti TaxID=2572203 RepID=UPI0011087DE0|nr:right-handed parallel beta-helix repeat-containing protein [Dyadobacter bucti]
MKKTLTLFCFLLNSLSAFSQTTPEAKAKASIAKISDNTIKAIKPSDFRNAYTDILNLAISRAPFLSMKDLRLGKADTARVVLINEGGRSGQFIYDPTDTTSPDDSAMVIRYGARRYKRPLQEYVTPLSFGAVGDSATDDASAVRKAAAFATAKKRTLLIEAGYVFTLNSTVLFGCNVDGYGTIKTRNSASFTANASNMTIKNITITGKHANVIAGRGLYISYASNVVVDNVKAVSTISQGIYFLGGVNIKAVNCRTAEQRGEYGDGIYFGAATNPSAANCFVRDFQRVGIVFEQGCTSAIAIGNTVKDSYPAWSSQFNGGIWGEKIKGAIFANNYIENVRDKSLTLSPNSTTTAGKTYSYIVSGNTMVKSAEGFGFAFSEDQILNYSDNTTIDVRRGTEIGPCLEATLSNSTFALRDSSASWFSELVRFVPITTTGKKTKLTIDNCKNYINGGAAVLITNVAAHKGDLTVQNCRTGNWAFLQQPVTLEGDVNFFNSNADFTVLGSTQRYLTNSINATFRESNLKIDKTNTLLLQGAKVEFINCNITADSTSQIQFGVFGAENVRFESCKIDKVKLYNIRKNVTKLYLINNEFTDYQSEGIFNTVVVSLNTLDVRGNKFSSTLTTNAPIQLFNGAVNTAFGINSFTSSTLVTQFSPKYDFAARLTNTSTSVPNKTSLNTSYGGYKGGTKVVYRFISTGARSYEKNDDSATSDWEETIYSTGIKSFLP